MQKVAGDENVLVVKFLEEETANLGAELMKNPVFNEVAEHGIFFGRKCYQFFGEFYFTVVFFFGSTGRSWHA